MKKNTKIASKSTKSSYKTRAERKPISKPKTQTMKSNQLSTKSPILSVQSSNASNSKSHPLSETSVPHNKKICIVCEKDVAHESGAVKIKEDVVIRFIRSVKKKLGRAKMNDLYVCKDDIEKHMKKRKTFENRMLIASVLCGILVLVLIFSIISSGKFDLYSLFSIIIICLLIPFVALLAYAPALDIQTKIEVKKNG